jgi:hypothetical protein
MSLTLVQTSGPAAARSGPSMAHAQDAAECVQQVRGGGGRDDWLTRSLAREPAAALRAFDGWLQV